MSDNNNPQDQDREDVPQPSSVPKDNEDLLDTVNKEAGNLLEDDNEFDDNEDDDNEVQLDVQDNEQFERVSTLPWDQKVDKLKEYLNKNCWQDYNVGDYIDAQDTYQKWMLAKIIACDQYGVEVRFDGWSPKWDLRFNWSSYKISPFRRCTYGYTGQPKVPMRSKMIFQEDVLAQEKIRLETLIERDLERMTAREITQLFRGHLYVYIDFLMSGSHRKLSQDHVDMIDEFNKTFLRLMIVWLRKVPKLFKTALKDYKKNNDMFLIDEDVALLAASAELFLTLKSLFSGTHRTMRLAAFYDKNVEEYKNMVSNERHHKEDFEAQRLNENSEFPAEEYRDRLAVYDDTLVFGIHMNYINYFANEGGFDALIEFLALGNIRATDDDENEVMPFEMLNQILDTFLNIEPYMDPDFLANFVQQIQDIVVKRLDQMRDVDIKELDRSDLDRILFKLQIFLQLCKSRSEAHTIIEQLQAKFAIRYLKTQYLEKKLEGLKQFKSLIDKVDTRAMIDKTKQNAIKKGKNPNSIPSTYYVNAHGQKVYGTYFYDIKLMREFLQTEQVLENIFSDSSHQELYKRAAPIIRFMSKREGMSPEIIDRIWQCQSGKHQETVRVIYDVITEMLPDLPIYLTKHLFEKVNQIKPEAYNEMYLQFVKTFTMKAFDSEERNLSSMAQKARLGQQELLEEYNFESQGARDFRIFSDIKVSMQNPKETALHKSESLYGMPILWQLVQDSNDGQTEEQFQLALGCLVEILQGKSSGKVRTFYLLEALNNLTQGKTIFASSEVLMKILRDDDDLEENEYLDEEDESPGIKPLTAEKALIQLEDEICITKIIMDDINLYCEEVKKALKDLVKKGKVPDESFGEKVFIGKMNHQATLNKLFEVLEFLVLESKQQINIKTEQIEKLWQIFVYEAKFVNDQTQFLSFINKKRYLKIRLPQQLINQQKAEQIAASKNPYKQNNMREIIYYKHKEVNLFTVEGQNHLFQNILCKPQNQSFKNISQGEAKCFYNLFKSINSNEGFISMTSKYNFEVVEFGQIVGVDSLWDMAFESDHEKIRAESSEILMNMHLRLDRSYELEQKRQILQMFIGRCMSMIEVASQIELDEYQVNKLLHVVTVLSIFLDKYEGKKPIKPEQRPSYFNVQPWRVNLWFYNGTEKYEGQVNIGQFETIGAFRAKCAEVFSLDLNEFTLEIMNRFVDPDVDDDKTCREHGMSQLCVLRRNDLYSKAEHPKFLISNNNSYFEKLFFLLSPGEKKAMKIVEPCWELLQKLPVNTILLDKIKSLQDVEKGWGQVIDSSSPSKLLYSLTIIESLDEHFVRSENDDEPTEHAQWKDKFVQQGGFKYLLDTFLGLSLESIDKLTLRCIESLVRALEDFSTQDTEDGECQKYILKNAKQVVFSCIRQIHLVGELTLRIETDRGESFEDMQQRKHQKKLAKQKNKSLASMGKKQDGDDSDEEDELGKELSKMTKDFNNLKNLVSQLYNFMNLHVFSYDRSYFKFIEDYQELSEFFKITLILTENQYLRLESGKKMRDMLQTCSQQPELLTTTTVILKCLLKNVLPEALNKEKRCWYFLDKLKSSLEDLTLMDLEPMKDELVSIAQELVERILNHKQSETSDKSQEQLFIGMTNILKVILMKYPEYKQQIGTVILPHLLQECLFKVPKSRMVGSEEAKKSEHSGPLCKGQVARQVTYKLISTLARDCLQNLHQVMDFMDAFCAKAAWRTNKSSDWAITHYDDEKSNTGYCGIKNLGCICYMISFFQQLFMNPGFRKDILAIQDPNNDNNEPDENMFLQLQSIFAELASSEKQYANPKAFCQSYKDWEGQPVNVLEQMDVEEFLGMFMDKLEGAIKGTPQQNTINHHFYGKFANEMLCKCGHYYERVQPFLTLSVEIKHKKNLAEGLAAFIQGEMLEGDNAYHCAKCDKKVDTEKRCLVKELPRFMIISLKRFELDMEKFVKVKLNDQCEFPLDLDMLPYTQEGVNRKTALAEAKAKAQENGEEFNEEEFKHEPLKRPESYYNFKLNGCVVHAGTADQGHYYSYIREQQGDQDKWYEFNDNVVSPFDIADLPSETFGGEEIFQTATGPMKTTRYGNAYLLVYERLNQDECKIPEEAENEEVKSPLKVEKQKTQEEAAAEIDELIDEQKEKEEVPEKKLEVTDPEHPIQQNITLENEKYWQNKFLFASEYLSFVADLTHTWDTGFIIPQMVLNKANDALITKQELRTQFIEKDGQKVPGNFIQYEPTDIVYDLRKQYEGNDNVVKESQQKVFRFAATFYLTILQRAQNKADIPNMISALKAYINHDVENARWLLKEFCCWQILDEMLLQQQDQLMPKLVRGLIYQAMLCVYEHDAPLMNNYWGYLDELQQKGGLMAMMDPETAVKTGITRPDIGSLGEFGLVLMQNLYKVEPFVYNYPHYFHLLARFASLGSHSREFLVRGKMIGRCIDFLLGRSSVYRESFQQIQDLGPKFPNTNPEMGKPKSLDYKTMTGAQALREKKRHQLLQRAYPKHKFLLETVGLLLRHIKIESSEFALDNETSRITQITEIEDKILIQEANYLQRVVQSANKTRSLNSLIQGLMHYAAGDKPKVDELVKCFLFGIRDHDFDRLRPYFCLLEHLIGSKQEYHMQTKSRWLTQFTKLVSYNMQYFKSMEAILEFINRLCCKSEFARQWFYENEEFQFKVTEWIDINQKAPVNCNLYKDREQNQQAMLTQEANGSTYQATWNYLMRKKNWQLLTEQKIIADTQNDFDVESTDFQDYKYLPGDFVVLYDRQKETFDRWSVSIVLDEMLSIVSLDREPNQFKQGNSKWMKCDTDKMIPEQFFKRVRKINEKKQVKDEWIAERVAQAKQMKQKQQETMKQMKQNQGQESSEENGSEDVESDDNADNN